MTDAALTKMWTDGLLAWKAFALAPQQLWQSINSGWSFGNVIINDRNSGSPQTEQAILAEASYGRQIGKLLDAVSELVKAQPHHASTPAYAEIAKLKEQIDTVKNEAATRSVLQFCRDLDSLRLTNPKLFATTVTFLQNWLNSAA